jgi:hypothetical protein
VVARQVLRDAHAVGVVALALLLARPALAAGLPAGVIDARPPDADGAPVERAAAVLGDAGLVPALGARADALAGRAPDVAAATRGAAGARRAAAAYGALRCDEAVEAAEGAALAWLEAGAPDAVRDRLEPLLAIMLLCAHQVGGGSDAFVAAARLRALGFEAPPSVPAEVWARYPEVDATSNRAHVPWRVEVAGGEAAEVWLDLAPAGRTPVTLDLDKGRHWVALAGTDGARVAWVVDARRKGGEVRAWPARAKEWISLTDLVAGWRRGGAISADGLAQAMRAADIVLTVVLMPNGRAEVWVLPEGAKRPVRVADADAGDGAALRAAVHQGVTRLAPPAAATQPGPAKPPSAEASSRRWTWPIVGALVVGALTVFLVSEAGDTTQRIEVTFP